MVQGCKHTLELTAVDPSIAGKVLFQINDQDDQRTTILEIEGNIFLSSIYVYLNG